jgi:hypothetical protein
MSSQFREMLKFSLCSQPSHGCLYTVHLIFMSTQSLPGSHSDPLIVFDDLPSESSSEAVEISIRYRQPSFVYLGKGSIPKGFSSLSEFYQHQILLAGSLSCPPTSKWLAQGDRLKTNGSAPHWHDREHNLPDPKGTLILYRKGDPDR